MKRRPPSAGIVQQYPAVGEIPRPILDSGAIYGSPYWPEILGYPTPRSPGHQPGWGPLEQQGPYTGPTIPEMDGGELK